MPLIVEHQQMRRRLDDLTRRQLGPNFIVDVLFPPFETTIDDPVVRYRPPVVGQWYDRMRTEETRMAAVPRLVEAYRNYQTAPDLGAALQCDALGRFSTLRAADASDAEHLADVVAKFMRQVAETRSVERFRERAA